MLNGDDINQQLKFEIIMIRQYRLWEIVDSIPIFYLISQLIHKELYLPCVIRLYRYLTDIEKQMEDYTIAVKNLIYDGGIQRSVTKL